MEALIRPRNSQPDAFDGVEISRLACLFQVANALTRLENVKNFSEFVRAFCQFGQEMVDLAQLTGNRQNDLKDERRRAQMAAARHVLERSTMVLLSSSKVRSLPFSLVSLDFP